MDTYVMSVLLPAAKRSREACLLNFEYVEAKEHPLVKTALESTAVQKMWTGRPILQELKEQLVPECCLRVTFKSGLYLFARLFTMWWVDVCLCVVRCAVHLVHSAGPNTTRRRSLLGCAQTG